MLVSHRLLWFNTKKRQEFIRITDEVAAIVSKSGVKDGTVLVSAMHITAGVYVNDWEDGLIHDFQVWLEKLAPAGLDYRHHQTGEDNADAHLKRTIMGHQVVLPITGGKLDLGPWEQVFYAEFDGQRKKRVVVKVMGISGLKRDRFRHYPDATDCRRRRGRARRCRPRAAGQARARAAEGRVEPARAAPWSSARRSRRPWRAKCSRRPGWRSRSDRWSRCSTACSTPTTAASSITS